MAKFINNKVVSIYGDNSDVSLCISVVVCASEPGTTNRVDRIYICLPTCVINLIRPVPVAERCIPQLITWSVFVTTWGTVYTRFTNKQVTSVRRCVLPRNVGDYASVFHIRILITSLVSSNSSSICE